MRSRFEESLEIVLRAKSGRPICRLSEEYGYPKDRCLFGRAIAFERLYCILGLVLHFCAVFQY